MFTAGYDLDFDQWPCVVKRFLSMAGLAALYGDRYMELAHQLGQVARFSDAD